MVPYHDKRCLLVWGALCSNIGDNGSIAGEDFCAVGVGHHLPHFLSQEAWIVG